MKEEMFLILKNHKEKMAFIENSDNWGVLNNDSSLLETRYLLIGERAFTRILVYEQEFPYYANNSKDTKANPPKWTRLEQFELIGNGKHPEYLVRVTNTELCDVLEKYQRKLRKELEQ